MLYTVFTVNTGRQKREQGTMNHTYQTVETRKVRLSGKLLKELPADVASVVKGEMDHYGQGLLKVAYIESVTPGYTHYCAEGEKMTMVYGDRKMSAQMVDGNTLGGAGLRHEIGARIPIASGAWVVSVSYGYGYGKYILRMVNVGQNALAA